MAVIKVEKNNELFDYGKSISNFVSDFELADADTRRQFNYKTEDAEGQAIQAFLERLNTIQSTVFDKYPDTLQQASETYLNYASALAGIGFSNRAWTSDSGVDTVAGILKGKQITTLQEVANPLQKSLDNATNLLGTTKEIVTQQAESSANDLRDSAAKRQDIDGRMQDAYKSFTSGLTNAESELTSLQSELDNAHLSLSIPVGAIVNGIKQGILTGDNINDTLTMISSQSDADVLKAVFEDDPEAIADVDPDTISAEVMTVVYGYFYDDVHFPTKEGEKTKLERLSKFLKALFTKYTGYDAEKKIDYSDYASRYSEKLLLAGDKYVLEITASLLADYPDMPRVEDYNTPEEYYAAIVAYEAELKSFNANTERLSLLKESLRKVNSLNGVFQGIVVTDIGKTISDLKDLERGKRKEDRVTFDLAKEGVTVDYYGDINFSIENSNKARYTVSGELLETSDSVKSQEALLRYTDLQKKRSVAMAEYVADLTAAGVTLYNSSAGTVFRIIRSFVESDWSEKVEPNADGVKEISPEKYHSGIEAAGSVLESMFALNEKMATLNKEQQKAVRDLYGQLFELGGFKVQGTVNNPDGYTNTQVSAVTTEFYYSLESILRMHDFEQNGLRRYIHDQNLKIYGNNQSVADIYQNDLEDVEALKKYLYSDSSKVAAGGETPLKDADIMKFYAEMSGESKIPDGDGFKKAKTNQGNIFKQIGGDEDNYHNWLDSTFAPYSPAE